MIKQLTHLLLSYVAFDYQLLGWTWRNSYAPSSFQVQESSPKSIAIVGAGSAGLASLKTLLDLPVEVRREWDIVLYEQRRDVGGVW